jgi:hypothetical protein
MNFLANRFYQPKPYAGTMALFIAACSKTNDEDRRLQLSRYAKAANIFRIPSDHAGLYTLPAVNELARQLQACLDAAEKNPEV